MANINVRVDDDIKTMAEDIADDIGVSLSAVITIFLKRFVAEDGFPFPVTASRNSTYNVEMVKQAIKSNANTNPEPGSIYYDSNTKKIVNIK